MPGYNATPTRNAVFKAWALCESLNLTHRFFWGLEPFEPIKQGVFDLLKKKMPIFSTPAGNSLTLFNPATFKVHR
jgi:hypothetical protein